MRYLYLVAAVLSLGIVGGLGYANEMVVNDSVIVEVGNKIPPMPKTSNEWKVFFETQVPLLTTAYECGVRTGSELQQKLDQLKNLQENNKKKELKIAYSDYMNFITKNNCMQSK